MTNDMKLQQYLDDLKSRRSVATYHLGRQALNLFLEYEKKTPSEILADAQKRQLSENLIEKRYWSNEIEKFYKWLTIDKGYGHNTARVYCGATETFFRTYGVNLEVAAGIHKVVAGLKCYVPTITEFRKMYAIADRSIEGQEAYVVTR
jgi:hypothetical protein